MHAAIPMTKKDRARDWPEGFFTLSVLHVISSSYAKGPRESIIMPIFNIVHVFIFTYVFLTCTIYVYNPSFIFLSTYKNDNSILFSLLFLHYNKL